MHFPISISRLKEFNIHTSDDSDLTYLAIYAIGLHLVTWAVLTVQRLKSKSKSILYH